jgi:acyl-CoA-binding protein
MLNDRDSWHKQKGKEKEAAKRQYVDALMNVRTPHLTLVDHSGPLVSD